MRKWIVLAALGLVAIGAAPAVAKDVAHTLPKPLQGRWGLSPSDCDKDDAEGRLIIEPRIVLFYATAYDVKRVARLKDGTLKITGFVSSEGEAGRERGGLSLKLVSPDRLQVDNGAVYRRCVR
jgi:hypothetical protein